MLFRCLHPMELDTGPLPKKSSILCSLLLFLATFSVLQVPGQAEIVKLGEQLQKENAVKLDITYFIGVKKGINFTDNKELDCDAKNKDGFVSLTKYEGKLCKVDLTSDFKFSTNDYRLLAATSPPKTIIQTTTTTTTETPPAKKCPECPTTTCTTTVCPTTKSPIEKECPENSNTVLYVLLVIGWIFAPSVIGIVTWFLMKKKDKENKKDNEKNSAQGLPSKKIDGTAANKKKTPTAGADGKKASNAVSDMAKNVGKPKAEGSSPSQYEEEG